MDREAEAETASESGSGPGPAPPLQAGLRLGEWVLEERLGAGGYATVWSARHHVLTGRRAAIKVPHEPALAEALRREGLLLDQVEGEHVVGIQGIDPDHDPPYLVADLIEGGSLRERHAAGPLEPAEALRILTEVARGLERAHARGVVHRDLKPGNVLLDAEGKAFVADFGLGIHTERAAVGLLASGSLQTREGGLDLAGTLRYMSPEQRDPEGEVDARSDLFALGVILFEMLTGEAPCGVEVPSDVVPGLDPRFDAVFRRLCARREARFPDVHALLAELEAIRAQPAPAPPDPAVLGAARSVAVPAGLATRGLAFGLDLVPFVVLAGMPLRVGRGPLLLVGALLLFVVYDVVATVVFGRTLGKRLCRLRIADRDGRTADPAQGLQRQAFRLISLAACGLGYLPALLPGGRALHDRLSGTEVVHEGPGVAGEAKDIADA